MILFAVFAGICALITFILLKQSGNELSMHEQKLILFALPILSLGIYLALGNPNIPGHAVAFESDEKRFIRILNAQDPAVLETIRQNVQSQINATEE